MAKDLDPFKKAMQAALQAISSPTNMRKYGETAASMIKLRTRLGDGVPAEGAEKRRLKALAQSTREQRKELSRQGRLSSETTPGKSNLTRTGQLLDSEGVTRVSQGQVAVGPQGIRDDGLTNEEVARYVTDQGRPFNHLSRVEIKRLNDAVAKDLQGIIERQLTRAKE